MAEVKNGKNNSNMKSTFSTTANIFVRSPVGLNL